MWYCLVPYKVLLITPKSKNGILVCDIQMEACAVLSCGTVVLRYKVVLTFKSRNENLVCDHPNENY